MDNYSQFRLGDYLDPEKFHVPSCRTSCRHCKLTGQQRQTRNVASHGEFERVPKDSGPRRKRRSRAHCPSCHCENSLKRTDETLGSIEYEMSKIPSSNLKNRMGYQRSQYHRPSTSGANFNNRAGNVDNTMTQRNQPLRDIVNSDDSTLEDPDPDFITYDHKQRRNFSKDSDYWLQSPPEVQSEPEMDSPSKRRDYNETKKRNFAQGGTTSCLHEKNEAKASTEFATNETKDDWHQIEKDHQQLERLREDLYEFANKRKDRQRRERKEREDTPDTSDTPNALDKINQIVNKLEHGNSDERQITSPKARSRSRKIDLQKHRETYPTTGMDGRGELNLAKHQQRKERKELGEELQLETSKLLEDEAASTTEEEARELAKKETETEMLERRLTDSWTEWQNGGKGNRQKDLDKNGERIYPKADDQKKPPKSLDRSKAKPSEENEEKLYDECSAVNPKENSYEDECNDEIGPYETSLDFVKRGINSREKSGGDCGREENKTQDLLEDSSMNKCYGGSAGDLEREGRKTKSRIDQMIDNGLNRETRQTKRNCGNASRNTNKEYDAQVSEEVAGRVNFDEGTVIEIENNDFRANCFCRSLAKILANHRDPREYVRKLKNRRWSYLNHIQSDLGQLYKLEKFLDSCSPERETYAKPNNSRTDVDPRNSKKKFDLFDKVKRI